MRRMKGEGSIPMKPRKDGRFCAVLTLSGGRRKFFYARTRDEVKLLLDRAKSDLLRGIPIISKNLTLSDWLDQWLRESVMHRVKPLTCQQYLQHCRLYLKPLLGRHWLVRLQASDVQSFLRAMSNKGLSERTTQLSLFF